MARSHWIAVVFAGLVYLNLPAARLDLGSLTPAPSSLTSAQLSQYARDGVVLVKGLLSGEVLQNAQQASVEIVSSSSILDVIFGQFYTKVAFQRWRRHAPFAQVAFGSAAPTIAAQLMGLTSEQPVRILKDAVFAYEPERGVGCGWHVDDKGFWPTTDDSPGPGVNVWIALSKINASLGGGLAVAPRSQSEKWARECRKVIAVEKDGAPQTCFMKELSPDCWDRLEKLKLSYDMEPGDALIHDRWIFHRSEPFVAGAPAERLMRYSVRYMPSTAKLFANGFEAAFDHGAAANDTLAEAGAYYPQAWPEPLPYELDLIKAGALEDDLTLKKVVRMIVQGIATAIIGGGNS